MLQKIHCGKGLWGVHGCSDRSRHNTEAAVVEVGVGRIHGEEFDELMPKLRGIGGGSCSITEGQQPKDADKTCQRHQCHCTRKSWCSIEFDLFPVARWRFQAHTRVPHVATRCKSVAAASTQCFSSAQAAHASASWHSPTIGLQPAPPCKSRTHQCPPPILCGRLRWVGPPLGANEFMKENQKCVSTRMYINI